MTPIQNSKFKVQNGSSPPLGPTASTLNAQNPSGPTADSTNLIQGRAFGFGVRVIRAARYLRELREYDLASQFLRSGTSVGANAEKAIAAQSRRDFIHKFSVALKEAREALYWIKLMIASETVPAEKFQELLSEAQQIVRILSKILVTCQQRYGSELREEASRYISPQTFEADVEQMLTIYHSLPAQPDQTF